MTQRPLEKGMTMKARTILILAAIALGGLAGCSADSQGASRSLGDIPMDKAFEVSKHVIWQYYSVETEDREKGKIICRPEFMEDRGDRFLGPTPARDVATLRLTRRGQQVIANVQVRHERQMLTSQRQSGNGHTYSGVPNDVPSDDAPTSKNTSWNLVQYDHIRENAILDDIIGAIEKMSATQPATAPATMPSAAPSSTKPAGH
jgi:hypothetical protein